MREAEKMFLEFGNDEVALIAYSLKNNGRRSTPVRAIVDKLGKGSSENWALLQGSAQDSEVIKGKRLASTVHRMKGLERDGVLVCGLDSFLENRYQEDPLELFNVWYVACTRAKKRMIVNITGKDYATVRCCPLLNESKMRQTCEVPQLVAYVYLTSFD